MRNVEKNIMSRRRFISRSSLLFSGIAITGSAIGNIGEFEKLTGRSQSDELPPYIIENDLVDDPLLKLGILNARHYTKGDGITDDSKGFKRALQDIYQYKLALYIPGGTYLVSETLDCRVELFPEGLNFRPRKGYVILGDPANRPTIKLADHANAFQNPDTPKSVLKIWVDHPERGEVGAWLMDSGGVSSIRIDCGKGNPGAIGFNCWGAQAQFVENITVNAHGAFAGIKDVIGNAGYMSNIEVFGGRYGIWAQKGQSGAINGLTLIGQETASIRNDLFWPLTITGFKIEKESGPAIEINDTFGQTFNGHLSLVDGTISLTKKSNVVINTDNSNGNRGRNVYMRDAYIRNADTIIQNFGKKSVPALNSKWTHVVEYAYACKDGVIQINGKNQIDEVIKLDSANPPEKLLSYHNLKEREIPFGLDSDTVCITDETILGVHAAKGDGVEDDTESFRYAISKYPKIFIPKGTFRLTGTISLKKETILFGISTSLSVLKPEVDQWNVQSQSAVITTPNDKDASCGLSQFSIKPSTKKPDWAGAYPMIDWRAGRHSFVKNVFPNTDLFDYTPNGPIILISENGGGRWYGFDGGSDPFIKDQYRFKDKYVHLLVTGTHEPLVIYSHCSIHGLMKCYNRIEKSKNIELYGGMDEVGIETGTYMKIEDSSNILISGHGGHLLKDVEGSPVPNYELLGCTNITMSIISSNYLGSKDKSGEKWYRIKDERGVIAGDKSVSYYRLGDGYCRR